MTIDPHANAAQFAQPASCEVELSLEVGLAYKDFEAYKRLTIACLCSD